MPSKKRVPRAVIVGAAALVIASLPPLAGAIWMQEQPRLAGPPAGAGEPSAHDIADRVAALAERLAKDPNDEDVEGWSMLARSYLMMGDLPRADEASRHVAALRARQSSSPAVAAESEIVAADGVVTAAARRLLERALTADPADPRARFYAALGRAQAGETSAALDDWLRLEAESPPDAGWIEGLRANIDRLAAELGLDAAALDVRRRSLKGEN
jgi:cytochrome c-type biogenesis protein CcmH